MVLELGMHVWLRVQRSACVAIIAQCKQCIDSYRSLSFF